VALRSGWCRARGLGLLAGYLRVLPVHMLVKEENVREGMREEEGAFAEEEKRRPRAQPLVEATFAPEMPCAESKPYHNPSSHTHHHTL